MFMSLRLRAELAEKLAAETGCTVDEADIELLAEEGHYENAKIGVYYYLKQKAA